MSNASDGLTPIERQRYFAAIEQLRTQNVVPSKGFLDLYGYTGTGEFVLAPNSFTRGYQESFLPPNQRPYLVFNFLGIFGQLSDQSWIFIPSYNRGMTYGNEQQNNLKFAVLAEGERRLYQELQTEKQTRTELSRQLAEAQRNITELERRVSEQNRDRNGTR